MTRNAVARIAGAAFFLYIIIGIAGLALVRPGSAGAALAQAGQSASALTLAVTLYLVTSPAGATLATLAMLCRIVEGVGGLIATELNVTWSVTLGASLFVAGSTLFSYLFLRGRMIPMALAWLGVVASGLLVVVLPLQLAGFFRDPTNWFSAVTRVAKCPVIRS